MKKSLALLLVLVMLFALTACGKDEKGTPTGESTGATTNTTESTNDPTDGTQDSTQGTTESTTGTETTEPPTTEPPTTNPPTTTPPTTETPHTHSYSSKVTKAATCTAKGVKTYTCSCGNSYTEDIKATGHSYSEKVAENPTCTGTGVKLFTCGNCGDTYKENIAATGHSWGEWKQTTAPSYTAKGEETRTCGSCSATEKRDVAQLTLDNIFKNYPAIITTDEIDSLGFFNSVNDLNVYKVFAWAIGHIEPTSTSQDNLTCTYSVSSLNGFTNKYLGCTFDYSLAEKDNGSEKVVYDATAQTVTITYAGGMGGMDFSTKYVGYEQIDDNHFVVTYETNYDAWPTYDYSNKNVVIEIEKVNDNYIITAHKKA